MRKIFLLTTIIAVVIFSACKKSTDDFTVVSVHDYYPLQIGKYITYNLDSTVFTNFGAVMEIHSYQVKHQVDALITDNLGRPAYRIIRYIRKTAANPWVPDNTFMAVLTESSAEFIENNMRYLKMKSPVRNGFSWKGNTYIDTYSLNSDVKYLDDWDYTYDSLNMKITLGALTIDSTLKVAQRDETIGNPSDPRAYSERNIGIEKYAKNLGLIYRRFLHTEYQPSTTGGPVGKYADGSYGITMTMIDHN